MQRFFSSFLSVDLVQSVDVLFEKLLNNLRLFGGDPHSSITTEEYLIQYNSLPTCNWHHLPFVCGMPLLYEMTAFPDTSSSLVCLSIRLRITCLEHRFSGATIYPVALPFKDTYQNRKFLTRRLEKSFL